MKRSILLRFKQAAATFFVATLATVTYGGLQIPYTPNVDTLHLYHFDGPTNTLTTTDEVVTAGITLTNQTQTQVPGTVITLGSPSAIAQLGTCLQIAPTNNSVGNAYGFAVNRTTWPDTTPFRNSTSGAFTIEAIVRCTGNPYVANGNWEIVAGDSGAGTRAWQFRIQTGSQPQLDFNFISGGGGNYLVNLPKSGPNILLQGIWYHVAIAYTGSAPTNGDASGTLTFYWTVLDGGRTNASILTNIVTGGTFTMGGTPVLGVGGSARGTSGNANGEGFKGYIDEVRITDLYLHSNELAFAVGGAATPPAFLQQPPTNTFIGYGQTLTLPSLVAGAPDYHWFHNGTSLPSQTDSTLLIPGATFAEAGSYQLIASNSLGSVTSVVAQVTIGAAFSELFHTGLETNGNLADSQSVDPHYTLYRSSDINNFGPNALVWNMAGFPIAQFGGGGTFANPDGVSQWIGEQAANNAAYTSPTGQYVYRTTFLLDSVDLGQPVTLSGVWYVNESGDDILVNGQSTGFANTAGNSVGGKNPANFTITNKFLPGLNTLDFVTTRSAAAGQPESALRVQMSGLGSALPAGVPVITNQPVDITVRQNGRARFSVVALGRPPLSYQWYGDSVSVTGATNRTLTYDPVTSGGQPSSFKVVVSNDSGSVTSSVVSLTLTTNRPPVLQSITVGTYSNTPVDISVATLVYGATDADLDPISFVTADATSTNGGSVTLNGINLTYMPVADYVGLDQFTYTLSDGVDTPSATVNIIVSALLSPTFATSAVNGTNTVFNGTGGAPGGTFRVLTTTNLPNALTNWTTLSTGAFDITGQFHITNAIAPGTPQRFYILQVP